MQTLIMSHLAFIYLVSYYNYYFLCKKQTFHYQKRIPKEGEMRYPHTPKGYN